MGARTDKPEPHWSLRLIPGSYEQSLGTLSARHRSQLRRHDRILMEHFKNDVQLRQFTTDEHLDELIRGSAELAELTYQARLGGAFVPTPVWRAILGSEARLGRLRAYWLVCGGRPISYMIGSVHKRAYYLDFMGYHPEYSSLSPGRVLHMRVLRDLAEAGIE
jgi:CelD/BcsL family acetyltransferase involved in cellulose biosynthesis